MVYVRTRTRKCTSRLFNLTKWHRHDMLADSGIPNAHWSLNSNFSPTNFFCIYIILKPTTKLALIVHEKER